MDFQLDSYSRVLEASPLQVDYALLAKTVQAAVSEAHVDGLLKERILKDLSGLFLGVFEAFQGVFGACRTLRSTWS